VTPRRHEPQTPRPTGRPRLTRPPRRSPLTCSGDIHGDTPHPACTTHDPKEHTMTLLTVDEAADRLATRPRFIRRLIAEKHIPYIKLGSHVRIDTTDLDAFIDGGRVQSTARPLQLGYPQPVR
jgi:excisionase family DNA binding protein